MPENTAQTNETAVNETAESLEIAENQDKATGTNGTAEVNEEVFEDESTDAGESKGQSKEENAKFAKERREREKAQKLAKEKEAEAKRKQELEEVRFNAIKETLGGINPYTKKEIVDKYDMDIYLQMRAMEKDGLDPLQDFAEYSARKQREATAEAAKKEKAESMKEWIENDRKDFYEKHPEVDFAELMKDETFEMFARGKVGNVPMASIYSDYQSLKTSIEKKAKEVASRMLANKQSSPGALASQTVETPKYTIEKVRGMSQKEILKDYDKIMQDLKNG